MKKIREILKNENKFSIITGLALLVAILIKYEFKELLETILMLIGITSLSFCIIKLYRELWHYIEFKVWNLSIFYTLLYILLVLSISLCIVILPAVYFVKYMFLAVLGIVVISIILDLLLILIKKK